MNSAQSHGPIQFAFVLGNEDVVVRLADVLTIQLKHFTSGSHATTFFSDGFALEGYRSSSAFDLIHKTQRRFLVRTPAQELCPVTKTTAGEVIVLDFDDELWCERFPFG